jgi:hypothetical protein
VEAGYGLFFMSPQPVHAPILTTGPPASFGIIGQPGTRPVIDGDIDYGTFSAVRWSAGAWLNQCHTVGIESSGYWLIEGSRPFSASSDGSVVLARPLIDATTGINTAGLVAFPGALAGSLELQNRVEFLTADANLMFNMLRRECASINFLLGFRYIDLWEQIKIVEQQQTLAPGIGSFLGAPLPAGAALTILDRFETSNSLYLGQLGIAAEAARGPLRIAGSAKVGLGLSHQKLLGDGRTTNDATGETVPGGVLAQTSYPSRTTHDSFVVAPEFRGKIGYQLTQHLQIYADYTILYVSSVARPGIEIDRTINPTLPPSFQTFGPFVGSARPTVPRNVTDLFVHGVSVGLNLQF